jgi:hypothetical protein
MRGVTRAFGDRGELALALSPYFERNGPRCLYHYTNAEGLIGIFASRSLWATQVQYLNDSMELFHAADLIGAALQRRSGSSSSLDALSDYAKARSNNRICVASLTEERDDLSQWRAYAGKGGGYALGFEMATLEHAVSGQAHVRGNAWQLAPVVYEVSAQEAIAEHIAKHLDATCRLADANLPPGEAREAGQGEYLSLWLSVGPLLKDPSFAAEREWRIVSPPVPHGKNLLSFRSGRALTPYTSFDLLAGKPKLVLPEVVVGPGPHPTLNSDAVSALAFEKGISLTAAPASRIPYRDW